MNNFWKGFCGIFDIGGSQYRKEVEKFLNKPIEQSLREDTEKIGQDFRKALNMLGKVGKKI